MAQECGITTPAKTNSRQTVFVVFPSLSPSLSVRVIAKVANVDVKMVKADSSLIEDFKLCDLGSGQTYCTLDSTVERQEGEEEFSTIASFT